MNVLSTSSLKVILTFIQIFEQIILENIFVNYHSNFLLLLLEHYTFIIILNKTHSHRITRKLFLWVANLRYSPRDRLFGLSSEVHTFNTGLLEKTSDGILKAAKIGDLQALKELHEKGYSLLSIDSTGQTALHLASRYGHKNIIRYLIACAPPTILNMIDNDK